MREGMLAPFAIGISALEFGRRVAGLLDRPPSPAGAALGDACALALIRSEQGHSYLDFGSPVILSRVESTGVPESVAFDGHRALLDSLASHPALRGAPALGTPDPGDLLVLEETRLYLRRLWEDEVWLAEWFRHRMNAPPVAVQPWLQPLLSAAFPSDSAPEQMSAAMHCLQRSLGIIAGGPGTGKTFIAARVMLAQAVAAALQDGEPPRMAVLAPTGKAARRLAASVAVAFQSMRQPMRELHAAWKANPPVSGADRALEHGMHSLEAAQGTASTLHAALESDPRGSARFRRGELQPLDARVVVVDEASMVSLAMMRALCRAVRPDASVVLLGDPAQLQSVEAGSVLADIVGLPAVFQLRASRRFPESSGLGRLAASVRAGDAEGALGLLDGDAAVRAQVRVVEPEPGGITAAAMALALPTADAMRDGRRTPAERLQVLESFVLLCAHRRGPGGADEINSQMVRRLAPVGHRWGLPFDGMPVLVLRNSRDTGLSNGDVGVVCADRSGALHAHFDDGRAFRAELLPEHAPAYALTVHKSQGSEYGSVALVLPERASPVATRELVYTALTRWKAGAGGVTIVGSPAVLDGAVRTQVQRASWLRQRMSGEQRPRGVTPRT